MSSDILNSSAIVIEEIDPFWSDLETIVLKERQNIIVRDYPNLKYDLINTFGDSYFDIHYIEIDIFVDSDRKDFVEQILLHIKESLPENEKIKQTFENLIIEERTEIYKDTVYYTIFDELMKQKTHVVLIIENFNQLSSYIKDNDYHKLKKVCQKKYKNKLTFILVLDKVNLANIKSYVMNDFISTFDCENILYLSSIPSDKIIYQPIKHTKMKNPEIYISYAWTDESKIVLKELRNALDSENLKYKVDEQDIDYKDNIREFEERLGKGDYIILIISDNYLKSKNCMYEILKIKEKGDVYNRVFPVVLKNAKIYNALDIIDYVKFWEDQKADLNLKLKTIGAEDIGPLRTDIDVYSRIRETISDIMGILREMFTSSADDLIDTKFTKLINAIHEQYRADMNIDSTENSTDKRTDNFGDNRQINQYGNKSIYIEKNGGDITIN